MHGLSKRYVLTEAMNLSVSYEDIREQAEALQLTNLFKYVCTPLNLGIEAEILRLLKRDSSWISSIRVMISRGVELEAHLLPQACEIVLTSGRGLYYEIISTLPEGVSADMIIDGLKETVKISCTDEQLKSFLIQSYLNEAIVDINLCGVFPEDVTLNERILDRDVEDSGTIQGVQSDMYRRLLRCKPITIDELLEDHRDVDVMRILRHQRVKNHIIRYILKGISLECLRELDDIVSMNELFNAYTEICSYSTCCSICTTSLDTCRDIRDENIPRSAGVRVMNRSLLQPKMIMRENPQDLLNDLIYSAYLIEMLHCNLNPGRIEVSTYERTSRFISRLSRGLTDFSHNMVYI